MFCEYCGNKLPDGSKFCTSCGQPVETPAGATAEQTLKTKPAKDQKSSVQPPVQENGKKGKGPVIALSIVLAVLVIAAIVLGVIFFGMGSGEGSSGGDGRVEKVSSHKENKTSDTEEVYSESVSTQNEEAVFVESTEGAAETNKGASESEDLFQGGKKGFVFPNSDEEKLTEEEIEDMLDESDDPAWDIRIAINELYARHGRIFDTPEIRKYLESQDWYEGTIEGEEFDKNQNEYLSDVEIYNRDLLSRYREELKN